MPFPISRIPLGRMYSMRRLLIALAVPLVLVGCSSGGGTSGSGSGIAGVSSGTTGLVIVGVLDAESFSSDTLASDCTVPPDGVIDQFVTTDLGTMTITVRDTSIVATSNNKGVNFQTYSVSFRPVSAGAPALATRSFSKSFSIILGGSDEASAQTSVVLVELDTTKPEFNAKNTTGGVFTYSVSVTYRGSRIDTGEAVSVTASTNIELGDFCD